MWLNGSAQTGHLFYLNKYNIIQEKRNSPIQPIWQMTSQYLGSLNVKVNGSSATSSDNGGLSLAAVYSSTFSTGPGARLYYHADDGSGTAFVQESRLSATVDADAVRLFYCSGSGTLQESYMLLSDP
ncbi:MAG: hypothetical protein M1838_005775 [Thelocarpon superellum]|nr:MAG: hypothetical protein M1838_005775 [Thelocarpon superellum]